MSKKETPKMYGLEHKLDSKCVYVHFIKSISIPIYIGEGSVERAFNFTNRNNSFCCFFLKKYMLCFLICLLYLSYSGSSYLTVKICIP